MVASGPGGVQIWNLRDKQEIARLRGDPSLTDEQSQQAYSIGLEVNDGKQIMTFVPEAGFAFWKLRE